MSFVVYPAAVVEGVEVPVVPFLGSYGEDVGVFGCYFLDGFDYFLFVSSLLFYL